MFKKMSDCCLLLFSFVLGIEQDLGEIKPI